MIRRPTDICDDSRLTVLLRGDEDSAAFRAASQHVETCADCQQRLATMAGSNVAWQEVHELFAPVAGSDSVEMDAQFDDEREDADRKSALEAVTIKSLGAPSHPELLGRLGRYDVERVIGSGGMGVVLKAFDAELNRPVAIKVLAPQLANVGAARRRFAREARAAAAVVHEHVVSIHNVESEGSPPFLVMQFIAGESLQGRLDRVGPLELREVLRVGMQTAAGLAAAHGQGLVHRDIKPANILLADGVDRVTITDFGLARAVADASVTCSGSIAGTPQYMSPEQARGESVDHRSDLFSLGSVLYALCAGHSPFRAETPYGVLKRICDTEPTPLCEVNPDVPSWLARLIARLHAKSPADRFRTADEVAQLLEACLAHVEQPTVVPLPDAVRAMTLRFMTPTRVGVSVASLAACGALMWVASRLWPDAAGQSAPTSTPSAPTVPDAQPPASVVAPRWHDESEARLSDVESGVGLLEALNNEFWKEK